jgi:hypothetical protein
MINPTRVTEIFMESLFTDAEILPDGSGVKEGLVVAAARGVVSNVGFNKARLETFRAEVFGMLAQLPLSFREDAGLEGAGGGMSFINLCNLESGEQWTGVQQTCEQLIQLAIGLGAAGELPLPREVLPGGVPYFTINLTDPAIKVPVEA